MAYTIRSRDLAGNANQAKIFDTDIRILADGLAGVGVVSGCAVTAQGSPDMTVAIAAGTIKIADGTLVTVTSGNGTIGAADATNPRIDLVSSSNAGTKTVTAGTAAANPKPPDLPSGNVGLAMVYVAANDTAISSGEITDKRVLLPSGGPSLLLDYALASDITNQAITVDTYFDLFANQNFTVAKAGSLIEVCVRGFGFYNDNVNDQFLTRINIDSAGTPILKYLSGVQNTNATTDSRPNPLAGGSIWVSGLSAAVHTIKVQITSVGSNNHFYCRASTNAPPTTGAEFLNVQVIEHP